MRRYYNFFILGISMAIFLYGCSSNVYSCQKYDETCIKSLFIDNTDEFTEAAVSMANSNNFWKNSRRDEETGHAWIMSPYDGEKMQLFGYETRNIVNTFFLNYKPYMMSNDYQRYITITFLNDAGNSGYTFVYYYDLTSESSNGRTYFEDWKMSQASNYDFFDELSDNWFLYYNR